MLSINSVVSSQTVSKKLKIFCVQDSLTGDEGILAWALGAGIGRGAGAATGAGACAGICTGA